jgi:hypothetical protein
MRHVADAEGDVDVVSVHFGHPRSTSQEARGSCLVMECGPWVTRKLCQCSTHFHSAGSSVRRTSAS